MQSRRNTKKTTSMFNLDIKRVIFKKLRLLLKFPTECEKMTNMVENKLNLPY